jgi:2-polyprenyl-6-methoxyphenol hydroxylase-like FAD-dependent oxidoreductase
MSTLSATTEVLIVGAGPTGLTLAAVLATEGVSFVLVDQLAEGANTSRAAVVHARTLEVLEELKVTDRLRFEGQVVPRFTVRDRDHVLATIRFDGLPTRYPYTLMVPQHITEAILLGRLRELGGEVHRPYVATDLRQNADGVTVTVAADGQPPQTLRLEDGLGTMREACRLRRLDEAL